MDRITANAAINADRDQGECSDQCRLGSRRLPRSANGRLPYVGERFCLQDDVSYIFRLPPRFQHGTTRSFVCIQTFPEPHTSRTILSGTMCKHLSTCGANPRHRGFNFSGTAVFGNQPCANRSIDSGALALRSLFPPLEGVCFVWFPKGGLIGTTRQGPMHFRRSERLEAYVRTLMVLRYHYTVKGLTRI